MYVIPSLVSRKKDNTGSSNLYVNYISKNTNGKLFNANREYLTSDEAIQLIDKNSKGGIRNGESRWYSPTYSFSHNECLEVVKKSLNHGTIESRNIKTIEDLDLDELKNYEKNIMELAILFQRKMAENFNKSDIGIKDEKDIMWFGSIEHTREFKGYDREVQNKEKKNGDKKTGFNTHIHIVQSRKGLNDKRSLISPMATAREKTKQNIGFNRNKFFNTIEQTLDYFLNYNRPLEQTFEHYKFEKKKNGNKTITQDNVKFRYNYYNKFIEKHIAVEELQKSNCYTYFLDLHQRGRLNIIKKTDKSLIFTSKNEPAEKFFVSENSWYCLNDKSKGGIINALKRFENYNWNESIGYVKYLNTNKIDFDSIVVNETIEMIQKRELNKLKNEVYQNKINLSPNQKIDSHFKNAQRKK